MAVAGASRYLNAATLANRQGFSAGQDNLISSLGEVSILDVGRNNAIEGVGISRNARLLNRQFLKNTAEFNTLFSLGAGPDATIEGAQQQILAMRSRLSDSQLARSLRQDDGGVSGSSTGSSVDTEA